MMMLFESCSEIRKRLFEYLEGECDPEASRSVRFHLRDCAGCRGEVERNEAVKTDLRALRRRQVAPELALRLRVALSHEVHRNFLRSLGVRLENALRPLLLPASAGMLTAIVSLGLIMGVNVAPVNTGGPDVPLEIATPARALALAPMTFNAGDQAVVVETSINAEGRVVGYRVTSGEPSPDLKRRLDRMIYFSLFQPATMFGRPTVGQVVLSFRQITVRG